MEYNEANRNEYIVHNTTRKRKKNQDERNWKERAQRLTQTRGTYRKPHSLLYGDVT